MSFKMKRHDMNGGKMQLRKRKTVIRYKFIISFDMMKDKSCRIMPLFKLTHDVAGHDRG